MRGFVVVVLRAGLFRVECKAELVAERLTAAILATFLDAASVVV